MSTKQPESLVDVPVFEINAGVTITIVLPFSSIWVCERIFSRSTGFIRLSQVRCWACPVRKMPLKGLCMVIVGFSKYYSKIVPKIINTD
jgi:hypothetical protein